jgi:hypothetical protein
MDLTNVAIGCSHTRGKYLPPEKLWMVKVAADIGRGFHYHNSTQIAGGLIFIEQKLYEYISPEQAKQTQHVVIQKPQAVRFPWWISNWREKFDRLYYIKERLDLVKGRRRSIAKFDRRSRSAKKAIAKQILEEEYQSLARIREFFPNAKMSYYYYWADAIIDDLRGRHDLVQVNVQLGERAHKLDIENWEMILDPKTLPGLYDDEGDLLLSYAELSKHGWVWHDGDPHPGPAFHGVVAEKVVQWITS